MKLKKRNSIAEKLAQMASPAGLRALALVPAVSLRLGGKMALLGVNSILNYSSSAAEKPARIWPGPWPKRAGHTPEPSWRRITPVSFIHLWRRPDLRLSDESVALDVNYARYGSPETRYCPAGVYEVVDDGGRLIGLVRGPAMFEAQAFEITAQAGTMVGVEKEERLATRWSGLVDQISLPVEYWLRHENNADWQAGSARLIGGA